MIALKRTNNYCASQLECSRHRCVTTRVGLTKRQRRISTTGSKRMIEDISSSGSLSKYGGILDTNQMLSYVIRTTGRMFDYFKTPNLNKQSMQHGHKVVKNKETSAPKNKSNKTQNIHQPSARCSTSPRLKSILVASGVQLALLSEDPGVSLSLGLSQDLSSVG